MPYNVLLWGMWLGLLLPAGTSAEKETMKMIGTLGESVTFNLESPRPFDAVSWYRNGVQEAGLRRETSCKLIPSVPYISQKVTVSEDCSSLTVSDLSTEDSAEYRARFQDQALVQDIATQTFILKVYKRLSEADLEVDCAEEISKHGNKTLHLNCSVGKWGDEVELSWTSSDKEVSFSEIFVVLLPNSQVSDQNVTCVAKNPIGQASRTVSLKQACAAEGQTTTRNTTPAGTETVASTQTVGIVLGIALVLLVAVAAVVWRCRRNKTAGGEHIIQPSSSGPKDCKSLYAEIQNVPESPDVETGIPQQRRGLGAQKETPTTIYADVQHPEKTPLQTDDEKIRREKRRAADKSEKTIYSEISDLKEGNKGNLKTIYDTVNHPRHPEASEYNKIL